MSKIISTTNEPPSWFSLDKYSAIKDMTHAEIAGELNYRSEMSHMGKQQRQFAFERLSLFDLSQRFNTDVRFSLITPVRQKFCG